MSKLSELITASIINSKKAVINEPYNVHLSMENSYVPASFHTEVKFTAVFGARYYIEDGNSEAIAATLHDVKRAVIEEIFGEFRRPLYEIQHMLYKHEYEKAIDALRKIEISMFHV